MNPYGWSLPATDALLEEMPYAPLAAPAENIAERLVMLGHLAYNINIWGSETGRGERYWPAFGDYLNAATANPDLPTWWSAFMQGINGAPIRSLDLLHEKNLLCRPTTLPSTQVDDQAVLDVMRQYGTDLRDRCRVWVKTRRELRQQRDEVEVP